MRLCSGYHYRLFAGCMMLLGVVVFTCQTAVAENTMAVQQADIVSAIDIHIVDHSGDDSRWMSAANDVISLYIKAGDPFSETDLLAALSALKQCGRFKTIDADSTTNNRGITLIFRLSPFKLIKEIVFDGQYPLFKNQVLNAMTVYPGDVFIQEVVDTQPGLIVEKFRREGYIDPQVTIGSWLDPEDSHYILFVNIDKGPYYTLGQIVFRGNRVFDDSVLKWRMKSWRKSTFGTAAGRFRDAMFKDDIKNVRDFYRKMDFADVIVKHELARYDDSGRVDAEITVNEGPRYRITFEGNHAFSDRRLRKELVLFDTGNRGGQGLRRSLKNLKALYRRAGFHNIDITVKREAYEESGLKERHLHLIIEEGRQTVVNRVSISGNTAYSQDKIRRQILTRPAGFLRNGAFVPEILEKDLLMIQNMYNRKGYMNPQIKVEKTVVQDDKGRDSVSIALLIQEGVQTRVSGIVFEGLDPVFEKRMYKTIGLRNGRVFRMYKLRNDERNIAALLSQEGYPYATVSGHADMSEDGSQALVVFTIDQGPKIEMGNTYYSGNFRTKKRILDREIEMKPGDAFSLQKMLTGQNNIRGMNTFRSVQFKPVGLKEQKKKVHLFAEIDEKDPYVFQANGGYESSKGLYAGSRLGDHNFFGLNKDVWVGGEISQTGYWAKSGMFEPRFWGTHISSDLSVFLERDEPFNQTFGTMKYGVNLQFSRRLTDKIKGNVGLRYERRQQFNTEPEPTENDLDEVTRSIVVVSPSIGYDSRDSFIRPRKGVLSFFAVDVHKGIENSLDDFYKYRFELRGFTTPIPRVTLAGRGSFSDIDSYGPTGIVPQDQLYYLGGTASVRGFDENLLLFDGQGDPVGGEIAAVASAEVRLDLGHNFEASVFYDVGYLNDTSGMEVTGNARDAYGVGLRYVTPIGAMGILYGQKIDPEPEESLGRIHFSIGYTF